MTTGNPADEPSREQGQQQNQPMPGPPYSAPMPGQPYSAPMPMRPDEEKLWAIAAHLGPLVVWVIAPLVVWLVFRDRSRFIDQHAKEALNMQISYTIYFVVSTISIILLVGILLLPVVGVAWLVLMIVATVKAANYEEYRYPLILRLVS